MAWLFGSSKKNTKQEVFVSNEVEGGFNVVSTRSQQGARYPLGQGAGCPYPVSGVGPGIPGSGAGYPIYPSLPQTYPGTPYLAVCPPAPPGHKSAPVHPLDSIPFKLSAGMNSMTASTTRRTLADLESIRNGLNRVSERMKSNDYSYSFDLERSVLREERMSASAN